MSTFRLRGIARRLPAVVPVALCGCFGQTGVPVAERSPVEMPAPPSYVVHRDDSLYSIAWRHELNFLDIADWNDLQPPYLIHPGDRLRLLPPRVATGTPVPRAVVAAPIRQTMSTPDGESTPASRDLPDPPPAPASTGSAQPAGTAVSSTASASVIAAPVPKPTAVPKPVSVPASSDVVTPRTEAPTVAANPPPAIPATVGTDAWRSPVGAKPVRGFGEGSKGLDYSLPPGTVIRAASSGVVVYAGPGLGGFRHLVIVKTSERHLVAYGVNVPPALREGDGISQGDTVARTAAGATAGDFHFEIRDRGMPVDPRSLIG